MEYHIYFIDYMGNPHFIQKATDWKSANHFCDFYFDSLYTYGDIIVNGTCYHREYVADIYMVRSDKDPYKGVIE